MYLAVLKFGGNAVEIEERSNVNELARERSCLKIVVLGMLRMVGPA